MTINQFLLMIDICLEKTDGWVMRTSIPKVTYRLQLSSAFTFKDAARCIPYLKKLGIDTVYCSPYFRVVPNTPNPYQITSPGEIEPSLGKDKEYNLFCAALKKHGMGHIVDLVSNHMAASTYNPWWFDVLLWGKKSAYAEFFDIDWSAANNKLVIPSLEKKLEEAILDHKVYLTKEGGDYLLKVYQDVFPICPDTHHMVNGPLYKLIKAQHYQLIPFVETHRKVNYRRFFDIHELVGLKMENPRAFDAYHEKVSQLILEGKIQGLRIDHPDGLLEPAKYLRKLRKWQKSMGVSLYVVGEKILQPDEDLRDDWSLHGTVGYEYLNLLNSLFVDHRHEKDFDKIYKAFSRIRTRPEKLLYQLKKNYMGVFLESELTILSKRLYEEKYPFTIFELKRALIDFLASFPVYRSYIEKTKESPIDRSLIKKAFSNMKELSNVSPLLLSFLKEFFYLKKDTKERRAILLRVQQLMPAVVAKGFEDTFLYVYNRLVSLNEVGGSPTIFGISISRFHEKNLMQSKKWPATILTSATHDTKRSEDVRSRIHVLSELPNEWKKHLHLWHEANKKICKPIDANTEYFFYQNLLGIWPEKWPDAKEKEQLIDRLSEYMLKSVREAKQHTSWVNGNKVYEKRLVDFVKKVLNQPLKSVFWSEFIPFLQKISKWGSLNSLSALTLRIGSPGVFDLYQGQEKWMYTLVDPDNRRPVDYTESRSLLQNVSKGYSTKWLDNLQTSHLKAYLLYRGLNLRSSYPEMFIEADYIPLTVRGNKNHVIAFMRKKGKKVAIFIATRFYSQIKTPLETTRILLPEKVGKLKSVISSKVIGPSNEIVMSEISPLPFDILTNFI